MKAFFAICLLFVSSLGFAQTGSCVQLSANGQLWSRTPEMLCVTPGATATEPTIITLTTDLRPRTIATFSLDLLSRARCMDCNQDIFGVANPTNSIFNKLKISFNGKRPFVNGILQPETGTVQIGDTTFFYRAQ